MLKNYLKIALRHVRKNKGYAFINLVGLSLGMACAILILFWVNDELRYNRFHTHYANLYQAMENQSYDGKTFTFAAQPGLLARAVKADLPEIRYAATTTWGNTYVFNRNDQTVNEQGLFVEPDFLRMFSFPLVKGDTAGVLDDVTSMLISEKMAAKFFPHEDPVGKTLKVNNDLLITVKGVLKDVPENSSISFDWLASFKIYEELNPWLKHWGNNGVRVFVELKPGADLAAVNKKLNGFIQSKEKNAIAKPFLYSISDWRLRTEFEEGKQTGGGPIEYVRLFSIIALLIIVVACINFMNLATARSEQRAREVGVRKVMGAGRPMLMRQFLGESLVMALLAVLLAALLVFLSLPAFNQLVGKKLHFSFGNPVIWAGLPALGLLCGLLAGSYPSLYLSSFSPTTVFRGLRIGRYSKAVLVRKSLVVMQFVVSIALIISTIIIYQQIQHVKNRQLGYNRENVLHSDLNDGTKSHFVALRHDLLETGLVKEAAISNSSVIQIGSSSSDFTWDGKVQNKDVLITMEWVSPEYIRTMGMQLAAGRDFYPDGKTDSSNIIINETFARIISKGNAVGKIVRRDNKEFTIVGVVRDFQYNDMYKSPEPLVLFNDTSNVNNMLVRLQPSKDLSATLKKVEAIVKNYSPAYPFEYKFLDEDFDRQFSSETMISRLSRLFAALTIIISCIGLFGLAAYTAERRTREIGIRKVLGASVSNLVTILCRDFVILVGISALVAFPLAWYFMHRWLNDYSYRVNIGWWVFVVAGLLALCIALLTVAFQAIKAAIANPTQSLRTE